MSFETVVVTGGTGSFGRVFVQVLLEKASIGRIVVFSRDEGKHYDMRLGLVDARIDYVVGDVRDEGRVREALYGADFVVHAAALKQIPFCEQNPYETILTNVVGSRNVVRAAKEFGIRALAISSDKAVHPANLYGATKLCMERLFVQAGFSCVRYGNVVNSRGSVVPLFMQQRTTGTVMVTDPRMTRFWLTLRQAAEFALESLRTMEGGEIFVPKLPSAGIMDVARVIAPGCEIRFTGVRPGEKLHEILVSEDEATDTEERPGAYIIRPFRCSGTVPEWFSYDSQTNPIRLGVEELRAILDGAQTTT